MTTRERLRRRGWRESRDVRNRWDKTVAGVQCVLTRSHDYGVCRGYWGATLYFPLGWGHYDIAYSQGGYYDSGPVDAAQRAEAAARKLARRRR